MQQSSLFTAKKLSPPVRTALEEILGRSLGDNEAVSIRAYQPHEAPSPDEQRVAADNLRHYLGQLDERTKAIPEAEQEEILDEAIRSVRPGYRA